MIALLVAGVRAGRPHARRHQHHFVSRQRTQRRRFFGRADDTVDADLARLARAAKHGFLDALRVSGIPHIALVVGREHRHGENAQRRAGAAFDRGFHRLRIGVHGQKRRAEARDAFDTALNRVADVVQLEVHENLLAGADQPLGERQAARIGELITDLVEAHAVAEPIDHRLGRRTLGRSRATMRRSRGAMDIQELRVFATPFSTAGEVCRIAPRFLPASA